MSCVTCNNELRISTATLSKLEYRDLTPGGKGKGVGNKRREIGRDASGMG